MITIKLQSNLKPTTLEKEIDRLLDMLSREIPGTETYGAISAHLAELYKLKEQEAPKRMSPEKKAEIASYLLGIVMILRYEKADIITSKAIGFVTKLGR